MTSLELLKEIEAWLSFNTEPSKEEIAKLRKSINDHICEQLNLPPAVIGKILERRKIMRIRSSADF